MPEDFNARFYYNIDYTVPLLRKLQQEYQQQQLPSSQVLPHSSLPSSTSLVIPSSFQVHILNFHSTKHNSITTALYCDILGHTRTPETCRYSQQRDEVPVYHKGNVAATAYDAIVLAAAEKAFIDINQVTRHNARKELERYHTTILNKTFLHLPLLCPSKWQLEQLLQKSLRFDHLVDIPELLEQQQQHIDSFWAMSMQFCWVDTERLLNGVTSWKQLLEQQLQKSWQAYTVGDMPNNTQQTL
jgi:hypothetical protein